MFLDKTDINLIAYTNALHEWRALGFPGIYWDWLKDTYGVEFFFDHENRKIENIVISNDRRYTIFLIKHGS